MPQESSLESYMLFPFQVILILSFNLYVDIPNDHFSSGFEAKLLYEFIAKSWVGSVGVQTGRPRNRSSIPGTKQELSYSPQCPVRLWDP